MQLRTYQPSDCAALAELFYQTIHTRNAKDYTPEQRNAWATGEVDLNKWNQSFLAHFTVVAVSGGNPVGFGDIDQTGCVDKLFVHRDYQGRGIASAICDALETAVQTEKLTTHASITARPFFEKCGYRVVRE